MHRSLINPHLRIILAVCGLWACSGAANCLGQQRPSMAPPAKDHGLAEILSQQLFRDRQIELLLRSAEAARDKGDAGQMRESLLPIFAHSHDVFEFDSRVEAVSSLQDRAIKLLLQSSPQLQQAWNDGNQIIAQQELQAAIRDSGRLAVARVARQFPLTKVGIQAEVIDLTCKLLKGDAILIAEQIRRLENMYSNTVLQSELDRQLRTLKKLLGDSEFHRNDQDATSHAAQLSISTSDTAGTTSPPWPTPLWTWKENDRRFPGAPQPDTRSLLLTFDPEAPDRIEAFHNWCPVFWHNNILLRTPLRIIALDRSTGMERWSIPTDTFERHRVETVDALETETERIAVGQQLTPDRALPIYGLAEFGLMSADSDFLFFIDRFAFLSDSDPFADNPIGRVIRNRNGFPVIEENEGINRKPVASRLVAVHRHDDLTIPTIAWQIGDGQPFSYDPVANVESLEDADSSGATTDDGTEVLTIADNDEASAVSDRPWSGHRFLSPPTGNGTQLYVLTLNETQIFLNCLERSTGDLLWRQPLIYIDGNALSFIDTSLFAKRTSTCIVSGDTVVCSLADGILIGVRAVDGTLLWATAIRDRISTTPQFRFGRPEPMEEQAISSPSILVPCIADGIVVCCNHASSSLYGVSLQNGEIMWKSSRRAFGAGEVGGSPDYYVAGICGSQIILVGDRHCRSVDLKSGDQNWAVQIPASSGRAACSGNRCVIPVRYGQAVLVDLSSGTLIAPSFVASPKGSMNQYGAMVGDEELICVATPTTVAVFPRVDALLNSADRLPSLTSNPTKRVLIQAQAHLINGDVDASLELLKDAVAARTSDAESVSQIDEFLAELMLQQWGKAISDACEGQQNRILSGSTERQTIVASEIVIPPDAAILSKLKLPKNVEFRTAVFDLLSDSSVDRRKSGLKQLRQQRDWAMPIQLTNQWSVRPELLFDLPSVDSLPSAQDLDSLSIEELRQVADHALQNPGLISDSLERERLVGRLIRRGEFASAELLLIRWGEAFGETDDVTDNHTMGLLKQVRSTGIDRPEESEITGLTSEVFAPLTFELLPFMQNLDADFDAMQRQVWVDFLPGHRKMQIYLSQQSESKAKLLSIDPADGSARDEVQVPFSIDRVAGWYEPLSDGVLTPSLFPVCGTNEMAMMSCSVPGKARSLWTKRFRNGEKEVLRVEFGALGSDHFIWHFADTLHCSDPLTGDDLWTRKLTLSHSDQTILHRGTNPSVRRIAGDRRATIVMGSDSRSYECFDTRDGRRLSTGRLNIGRSESVVAVGRCLLYADSNGRLHLFDSVSGKDELEDADPISPLSRDDKTVCQVLEDNRVLVVSSTMELILIDVDQGRVVFRIPASKYVKSGFVFSFSAFERHGRLFAALSGEGRSGRSIQQAFMRGSPYLSNGPLLCLNPLTGEVQWSMNVDQGIFPDIHGDPTDLLISWSSPKPSLDLQLGYQAEDKLIVEVYDENTGQLIAQSPVFSSLPPVRCVHLADENLFRLTTPNATVSIRAPSID